MSLEFREDARTLRGGFDIWSSGPPWVSLSLVRQETVGHRILELEGITGLASTWEIKWLWLSSQNLASQPLAQSSFYKGSHFFRWLPHFCPKSPWASSGFLCKDRSLKAYAFSTPWFLPCFSKPPLASALCQSQEALVAKAVATCDVMFASHSPCITTLLKFCINSWRVWPGSH